MLVGDHSNGGVIIGGALKSAGFSGIIRYACGGRGDVNITPAEIRDISANGLGLGIVVEHEADWMLNLGRVTERVKASVDICRACGVPDGVLYLACDFDAQSGDFDALAEACKIAAGIVKPENVGFYGGIRPGSWLLDHLSWLRWFWQTEAWSGGQVSSRAQILQRANSINVNGVDIDLDPVLDAGIREGWGARGVTPIPPPPPPEVNVYTLTFSKLQDGRPELFLTDSETGEVFHTWREKTGNWSGAQKDKRNAQWYSLGKPGQ